VASTATKPLQITVQAGQRTVVLATSDFATFLTTIVDANGNFTFSNVKNGTYILRVGANS